jgi:oligosaccharide amylase
MARSIVVGNGNILVCLDRFGLVRDFYYPYVGLENHIGGRDYMHKIGVWVDGRFSWLDSGEWEITTEYEHDSMISHIIARHRDLGIVMEFSDVVYNENNIFLRHLTVTNQADRKRDIKVFFHQQFNISESSYGNTAYVNKDGRSIIHYKRRRVFIISGKTDSGRYLDDYAVGGAGFNGKEGTWKDAEDGKLSKNPIEHGSVDSTIAFSLPIGSRRSKEVTYWIAVGETLKDVVALNQYVLDKTPAHLEETTRDYWYAWLNKRRFTFDGLDSAVTELFKRSLLIIRSHVDNRGSIIASADGETLQHGRDTYSYMWPRDAAFVALSLDQAGYFHIGERFYTFCNETITTEGFLLHKYNPDRSFGSSWHPWIWEGEPRMAIQEDETALPLYTLWEHYVVTKDLEFIENIYNSFIKKAADFLVSYRDQHNRLPLPSYDLWEERYAISLFTVASVHGALNAAGQFAKLLGKEVESQRYMRVAEEVRAAAIAHFYNEETKVFSTRLYPENGKLIHDDSMDASTPYSIFRFGLLPPDDERLVRTFDKARERLTITGTTGGIARYEGDRYLQVDPSQPGNPWFITTLWFAEYRLATAKKQSDLDAVRETLSWVASHALSSGVLSEQLDPHTGEQLSVAPLVWSHAGFVLAVIAYLKKLSELGLCEDCYPVIS